MKYKKIRATAAFLLATLQLVFGGIAMLPSVAHAAGMLSVSAAAQPTNKITYTMPTDVTSAIMQYSTNGSSWNILPAIIDATSGSHDLSLKSLISDGTYYFQLNTTSIPPTPAGDYVTPSPIQIDVTAPTITVTNVSNNQITYTNSETLAAGNLEVLNGATPVTSRVLSGEELTIGSHTTSLRGLTGLTDGVPYTFQITGTDAAGNIATTTPSVGMVYLDPNPPTIDATAFKVRNTDTDPGMPNVPDATLTKVNRVDLMVLLSEVTDASTPNSLLTIQFSNDDTTYGTATDTNGSVTNAGASVSLGSLTEGSYAVLHNWYLTTPLEKKIIYAKITDQAGNSTKVTTKIWLETAISNTSGTNLLPGTTSTNIHPFAGGADDVVITNITTKVGQSATISAARYTQNPDSQTAVPAGAQPLGKYIDLTVSPRDAIVYPVTLRFYFTQTELDAAGATIGQVVGLAYQDANDGVWHPYNAPGESNNVVSPSDRTGFAGYVESTITHFTPITILVSTTPPVAPANIAVSIDGTTATIAWNAVPTATNYTVTAVSEDGTTTVANIAGISTKFTGLIPGKKYTFTVYALNAYGLKSAGSTPATVQLPAVTPATAPTTAAKPAVETAAVPVKVKTSPSTSSSTAAGQPTTTTPASPAPSPTPTPTPTETSGATGGTQEEGTTTDRTPWVVLGILILLAAAATAGYFYWFREEEEIDEEEIITPKRDRTPTEPTEPKTEEPVKEAKERDADKKDEGPPKARW